MAVANGQRVPEDWHRLSSHALVQRALRATAAPAWKVAADEVNLVFAAPQLPSHAQPLPMGHASGAAAGALPS